MLNYLVLDIENDNTDRYGRNAGNFLYDKIVAIGFKERDKEAEASLDGVNKLGLRLATPQDTQMLVGHHIKHDLLFLWKAEYLQMWLKQGGIIWDTQLVEYILSNYKHKYPALRDIAVQKYGCKERAKHIDDLLFSIPEKHRTQYKQVSDLPKELVLEDVKNDVLDTETIFLKQYEEVNRRGLMDIVKIENECLLSIIETEYNGFKIDKEKLKENKKAIELELEKCYNQLNKIITRYWKA